jgi:hypothetical protein
MGQYFLGNPCSSKYFPLVGFGICRVELSRCTTRKLVHWHINSYVTWNLRVTVEKNVYDGGVLVATDEDNGIYK